MSSQTTTRATESSALAPNVHTDYEQATCPICGKNESHIYRKSNTPAQLVRCKNDRMIFLNPRPMQQSLEKLFRSYVPRPGMFDDFRRSALQQTAQKIQQLKFKGDLLDVGCSIGTFFENFDRTVWNLNGIESSEYNALEATKRYSVDVFCGQLQDAGFADASFDVIVILDTLFYFSDLVGDMNAIHRWLRPNGLLVIELPGWGYSQIRDTGPLCWVLDRKWSRFDPLRLYYFSPHTMRKFLATRGFVLEQFVVGPASVGGGRWVQQFNSLYWSSSRFLSYITSGNTSIAAREIYFATKPVQV